VPFIKRRVDESETCGLGRTGLERVTYGLGLDDFRIRGRALGGRGLGLGLGLKLTTMGLESISAFI